MSTTLLTANDAFADLLGERRGSDREDPEPSTLAVADAGSQPAWVTARTSHAPHSPRTLRTVALAVLGLAAFTAACWALSTFVIGTTPSAAPGGLPARTPANVQRALAKQPHSSTRIELLGDSGPVVTYTIRGLVLGADGTPDRSQQCSDLAPCWVMASNGAVIAFTMPYYEYVNSKGDIETLGADGHLRLLTASTARWPNRKLILSTR